MTLIKCPECGKEYSNKASICPKCACPTENFKSINVNVVEKRAWKDLSSSEKEKVKKYLLEKKLCPNPKKVQYILMGLMLLLLMYMPFNFDFAVFCAIAAFFLFLTVFILELELDSKIKDVYKEYKNDLYKKGILK